MNICLAQIQSKSGALPKNINRHLDYIDWAVQYSSDIIFFPELSITNYEPSIAREKALDKNDSRLNPFQKASDQFEITIGIGLPLKVKDGITISMLLFQPRKERTIYSKRILHEDEYPYFVSGSLNQKSYLDINGTRVALGICYETLQNEHIRNAKEEGADMYLASVSKPQHGTDKAFIHFPSVAKEYNMPIFMCNSIGESDDFVANGMSAIWNEEGTLLAQLNEKNQGILIYNTLTKEIIVQQETIVRGGVSEKDTIFLIYQNARKKLEENGLFQWVDSYPTPDIILDDLKNEELYIAKKGESIIGAVSLSEHQEKQYQTVDWKFDDTKVLVIHRLVIDPQFQGLGYAQKIMDFAEKYGVTNGYSSVRLDAYSQNSRVLHFYEQRGYVKRGEVYFPKREFPFYCMETII